MALGWGGALLAQTPDLPPYQPATVAAVERLPPPGSLPVPSPMPPAEPPETPVRPQPVPQPATIPPPAAPPLPPGAAAVSPTPASAMSPDDGKPIVLPKIWEGSLEIGINGTDGNSETLNLRGGGKAKRKTDRNMFSIGLDYHENRNGRIKTASRAFLDARDEVLFPDSPWTCFVHSTSDYDEFAAFDLRVAADVGVGYRFIKSDATSLLGRFGSGFSHEIGGVDDRYVPEGVFGMEFEHKFNCRHKLTLSTEYMPDWTNFDDYRLHSKAGWEIVLDEVRHLSMKLGVLDRYDSTPHGKKPNDLEYSLMLLWGF
jgi:putative salt-induced outer membrane protein YdiY